MSKFTRRGGQSPAAQITAAIIEKLEQGTRPWVKPWRGLSISRPLRSCGTPYRGMNTFWLWMIAEAAGLLSPYWMTYRQCEKLGGQVRKGEKSTIAIFYKSYDKQIERDDGEEGTEKRRVARDPESRETKGGTSVTGITVVTDRPARDKDGKTYKDENGFTAKDSEFHRVTCFNGLSKTVGQYCTKGQLVSVQGRLHYTQWEDQEGVKRYGCEILADKVDFLSRGNARDGDDDNRDAPEID